MYFKIKKIIFAIFYSLLVLRFLFLIGDPRVFHMDMELGHPIYSGMSGLIDATYLISNLVLIPVNWAFDFLFLMIPAFHTQWFPSLPASEISNLPGVFDWLALLSIIVVTLMNPVVDKVYTILRNMLWSIFVELSFTGKKHALYQDTLKKRAKDLMKLNVEYRNLSEETSQLKDTVITDDLTQIYNRRFFHQKMEELFTQAKKEQSTLTIVMMDIDYFKNINDKYGHLMGDTILKDLAQVLQNTTPANSFIARYGGEEFAMIIPDKKIKDVKTVANEIQENISQLCFHGAPELQVTISQGIAHLNFSKDIANALDEFNDFVRFADDELYRAKLGGRNMICINDMNGQEADSI